MTTMIKIFIEKVKQEIRNIDKKTLDKAIKAVEGGSMREIKFRAWNKEKKIMVYKNEDGSSCFWDGVIASSVELINTELNSEMNQNEYEFMQYTGLKDKNGVEIYEGDIVKYHNEIGYIKYGEFNCSCCNGVYGWVVEPTGYYADLRNYEELEVIGNIYDNPELLEKEGK